MRSSWSPTNSSSSEWTLVVISIPSLSSITTTRQDDNNNKIQRINSRSAFIRTGKSFNTVTEVCKTSYMGNIFAKSIWNGWKIDDRKSSVTRDHDIKGDQISLFKTSGVTRKYTSWYGSMDKPKLRLYRCSYTRQQIYVIFIEDMSPQAENYHKKKRM